MAAHQQRDRLVSSKTSGVLGWLLGNCTGGGRSFHLVASLKNHHAHAEESPSTLLLTCLKKGDRTETCPVLTSSCTGPTDAPKQLFSCSQGQTLPLCCPGSGGISLPCAESRFPKVELGQPGPLTPAELSGLSPQPPCPWGDKEEHGSASPSLEQESHAEPPQWPRNSSDAHLEPRKVIFFPCDPR